MWQREFGASVDVIGEEIRINSVTARISGIAPDWLEGIYRDRPVDVWMPLPEETLQRLDDSSRNLWVVDRKSTRLNSSHGYISYAVFCLKKKKQNAQHDQLLQYAE